MLEQNDNTRPLVLGHRGAVNGLVENTMESISQAMNEGAYGVEIDARVTLDGIPVVFHDSTLTRLTGNPARIQQVTFSKLQEFALGPGVTIPSLEYVLSRWVRKVIINIEIKEPQSLDPVLYCLSRQGRLCKTYLTSFHEDVVRRANGALPNLKCGLIMGKLTWHPRIRAREFFPFPVLKGCNADFVVLHYRLIHPFLRVLLRYLNYPLWAWCGMDEEQDNWIRYYEHVTNHSVDAIITRYPARFFHFLKNKKTNFSNGLNMK